MFRPDHLDINYVFLLMVVFQVKHFLADFPLQIPYMLRKQSPGWDFIKPLALHCAVHAGTTLLVVMFFDPTYWWLTIVDFFIHFTMDRLKSGPHYLGRYNDVTTTAYWTAFGFDQMVHHLTHIYFVWVMAVQAFI